MFKRFRSPGREANQHFWASVSFGRLSHSKHKHAEGKTSSNAIQTNATLLDDEWGLFLAEHRFLVGVSIDGPPKLHDSLSGRQKGGSQPTMQSHAKALGFLKKHGVEFNTLTVVNRINSKKPLEVYRFLKEIGSGFIQFIPLVERSRRPRQFAGRSFSIPPRRWTMKSARLPVTEWSVEPDQYGKFLTAIFDEWVKQDVGKVFVQLFDVALGNWMGMGGGLCVFSENCGSALAMEHNGDVYSCDHYVYPRYKLGNLLDQDLGAMAGSPEQRAFGQAKSATLPAYCRSCEVRFACHGECPKHRFLRTPDGEPGLNYLCPGLQARFFTHVDPAHENHDCGADECRVDGLRWLQ